MWAVVRELLVLHMPPLSDAATVCRSPMLTSSSASVCALLSSAVHVHHLQARQRSSPRQEGLVAALPSHCFHVHPILPYVPYRPLLHLGLRQDFFILYLYMYFRLPLVLLFFKLSSMVLHVHASTLHIMCKKDWSFCGWCSLLTTTPIVREENSITSHRLLD